MNTVAFTSFKSAEDLMGPLYAAKKILGWTTYRAGRELKVRIQTASGWRNLIDIDLSHMGVK